MSTLPSSTSAIKEKSPDILPDLPSPNEDSTKSPTKRDSLSPQSLPARNSSLQKPSPRKSEKKNNLTTAEKSPAPLPKDGPQDDDKPPTPPPKPERTRRHRQTYSTPKTPVVQPIPPPKKNMRILEKIVIVLASCCSPGEGTSANRKRITKDTTMEMESVQKEDVPTTSTASDKESETVSGGGNNSRTAMNEDTTTTITTTRPTVTIATDVITEKEANGQTRIITPTILPSHHEEEEEEAEGTISTDEETRERERALRESMSIQAPYPPNPDLQQSEAVVVSPTLQISVTGTESEESETEDTIVRPPLTQIIDEPQPRGPFLGQVPELKRGRKCLILDLDECLIHSTFADSKSYDFSIALNLDKEFGLSYIYVGKRPHLDEFLEEMGKLYEIVIFTASLQRYADPVVDIIDRNRVIDHRLFRDSCTRTWDPIQRIYLPNVKNISLLGRDLKKCIIIDNNPQCYQWHPEHAVPISSWFEDHLDVELLTMIPLLKDLASDDIEDVRDVLSQAFHHA